MAISLRYLLLLLICSGISSDSFSQTTAKIDSLENLLKTLPDDTVKVAVYTKLNNEWSTINPRVGIDYCNKALPLAKKLNWRKGIAVIYIGLGFSYGVLGVYDTALFYNDSAIVIAEEIGDPTRLALVYINRGSTYLEQEKLGESQQDFMKAIKFAEASGNTDRLARAYMALGNVYYKQDNFIKASENYEPAVHLFDSIGNSTMKSIVLMNLGNCDRKMKKFVTSKKYYEQALKIQIENEDATHSMDTYSNLAHLMEAMGDTASAIKNYEKALEMAFETNDKEMTSISAANVGDLYLKTGATQRGMMLLEKAYLSAIEGGLNDEQFNATSLLAGVYARSGDFKKAYHFLNEAMSLNDTLLKSRQESLLTEMQTKYETEKKEKENSLLKTENDLQNQRIRSKNFLLYGSALGILLLAVLVFFIRKNYRNEKRNVAILDKLNHQLTDQRDEILTINRLLQLKVLRTQMNPHFIYNCLNAINNLVTKGENEKASGYLLSFSKLLRMILDFSDKTFIDLEDEVKFIQLYLSLEAMRMGSDFSYDVLVDQEMLDDDISIPSLIIQPFIENAIWHGLINKTGEKKLVVRFEESVDKNRLRCVVDDNGIGRSRAAELKQQNPVANHESKGIKISQERLELLQYQMKNEMVVQINDKLNGHQIAEGTRVELLLPVLN